MKPILEVRNIGKRYKLQHQVAGYLSLRERMVNVLKLERNVVEDFWALNDISFDIHQGESIGIIGRNGAGKSTLLKVLSKITPPTTGHIISRGRIASLLEVGTGFHPELTGRENVFFNGSLLGMRRKEIANKFDEIVDFSGVEKFLDTPLKHFSSGMQLRLAFAVAAFLEPEILIIDEVLAVGDAEFQKKCLGKMEDVSKSGRTILFVSHNMAAVQSLCSKCVLLSQGSLVGMGNSPEMVNKYLDLSFSNSDLSKGSVEFIDAKRIIKKVELFCDGERSDFAYMGCALEIVVHFSSPHPITHPVLGVIFKDSQGVSILGVNNNHYVGNVASSPIQSGRFSFKINYLPFIDGNYSVDIHLGDNITDVDVRPDCLNFVVEKMSFAPGNMPDARINKIFIPDITWSAK